MVKTWINREKGEDKIIAMGNEMIYKANPKADKVLDYIKDLENDVIPIDVFCIPFSYIKNIQYHEGQKYLQIFFGHESEEHFRISDSNKRLELFNYFKEHISNTAYRFEKFSASKSAKKPMIAVGIVSILFAWTLYLAIQIEMGSQYVVVGSKSSITGLVLGLANLGILEVILIFGSLVGIGLYSMIRKMRNPPPVHDLAFIR